MTASMLVDVSGDPDPESLGRRLEEARAEELAALNNAAALLRANSAHEEVEAAYRRCEQARAKKNKLLEALRWSGKA